MVEIAESLRVNRRPGRLCWAYKACYRRSSDGRSWLSRLRVIDWIEEVAEFVTKDSLVAAIGYVHEYIAAIFLDPMLA